MDAITWIKDGKLVSNWQDYRAQATGSAWQRYRTGITGGGQAASLAIQVKPATPTIDIDYSRTSIPSELPPPTGEESFKAAQQVAKTGIPEEGIEIEEGIRVMPDYSVVSNKQTIGSIDPQTGDFVQAEPGFWEKAYQIQKWLPTNLFSVLVRDYGFPAIEKVDLPFMVQAQAKDLNVIQQAGQNLTAEQSAFLELYKEEVGAPPSEHKVLTSLLPHLKLPLAWAGAKLDPSEELKKAYYDSVGVGTTLLHGLTTPLSVAFFVGGGLGGATALETRLAQIATKGGRVGRAAQVGQMAVAPMVGVEQGINAVIRLPVKYVSTATKNALNTYINKNAKYIRIIGAQREYATLGIREKILYKIFNYHNRYMVEQAATVLKAKVAARRGINQGITASTQTMDNIIGAVQGGEELTRTSITGLIVKNTPDEFVAGLTNIIKAGAAETIVTTPETVTGVTPTITEAPTVAMAEGETVSGIPEVIKPTVEPEALSIPEELPAIPPPLTPEGNILGRSDNNFEGFMADLQDAEAVASIAFRNDMVRKAVSKLPGLRELYKILNPSVIANTPAEKSIVIRATLRDEGYQKTQGVMAYLQEVGNQEGILGNLDSKGFIESGALKGNTVGDIAQARARWESKLTDEQKFWLDRANAIEESVTKFLQRNGIDINLLHLEEGGQFATRRVWGRTLGDNAVIDVAYVGAGPGRPGARLPTEKARFFKTEAEAIEAGYRYIPYEEALYLKVSGAYNRVADKEMADWLLTKVTWRTTGASEELKLVAEAANLKKRHSQMLLAAVNRAVRGERIPDVTIRAIATSYPDQAQALKDLIPRLQAGKPTAKEVKGLTNVAKGLVDTNKMESYRAIAARAMSREAAMVPRYGEAIIPAPAFSGKILTGPEAKETARVLRESFEPSFSKALGEVNKANAVARYFMLAGDFSPFTIQLLFLMGENPKIYGKAFAGAIRAMLNPDFQANFLSKHKATIDRHPNLLISKGGGTEFTEAMARGGWLSGKTSFRAEAEPYWKSLSLFLPRAMGKVGGTVLTPFQRVFESSLDEAGIYMAEAYDHLCTTPENTADVDQFINEFRGLTSSARIGISGKQRQLETLAILAPRYNRAIAGLLFDLSRGNIRGHLARKALIKGIAALVALATAISIARGEDKDEILEHFNPNSSNFFTWDIAGQKIGPGSKIRSLIKLVAQSIANADELLEFSMDNPALRFIRGNLSPIVSSAVDLITGRSYIGDPTRDGILSFSKEILAGNLLPIWVQSVLLEGGDILGRTARGLAEFFGGRAYPEPLWDEVRRLRDKYAQQDFRIEYEELNRAQIDRLKDNHPDLAELEEKARVEQAERGSEFEQAFYTLREETVAARNDGLEKAAILLQDGTISKYDYDKERGYIKPYYSGGMGVLYALRDRLDPEAVEDINKWLSENQKPEDKALDAYQELRASLIEKADLPRDWDEIETQCDAFLNKYTPAIRDYVKDNLHRWINDLPENAKQIEMMRLQGIEDETWWDDYRGVTAGGGWQQYGSGSTSGGSSWQQYG